MAKKSSGGTGNIIYSIIIFLLFGGAFGGALIFSLIQIFGPKDDGYKHNNSDYCDITAVDYRAHLSEKGDLEVSERLTYNIKTLPSTPYNELYREFYLSETDISENVSFDMDSFRVTEHRAGGDVEYTYKSFFPAAPGEIGNEDTRTDGTFCYKYGSVKSGKGTMFELRWYITEGTGTYGYTLHYTYKNVLDVYDDAAELNLMLFSGGALKYVKSYNAEITFPEGVIGSSGFKVYPHNQRKPVVGTDGNTVKYSLKNLKYALDRRTIGFVELRCVMGGDALSIFSQAEKRSATAVRSYSEIIAEETRWAAEKKRYDNRKLAATIIDPVLGAAVIAAFIFLIRSVRKKCNPKPPADYKYYRELPDGIEAATALELLAKNRDVRNGALSATILSLCRKGALSIISGKGEKMVFNVNLYTEGVAVLTRNGVSVYRKSKEEIAENYAAALALDPCERYVYDVFCECAHAYFDKVIVTFADIRKYFALRTQTDFPKDFAKLAEGPVKPFVNPEPKPLTKILAGLLGFLGTAAGIAALIFGFLSMPVYYFTPFIAGLALTIGSIVAAVKISKMEFLTQQGIDKWTELNGLYNFFNDLTLIDEADLPQVERLEEYLVYATAFGLSKKVIKALTVRFPQIAESGNISYLSHFGGSMDSISAFTRSVSNNSTSSFSRPSSSGGSDGGGSSGGGGGGGGGGHGGGGGGGRH